METSGKPDYRMVELKELDEADSKQFLNENLMNHIKITDTQMNELFSVLGGHLLAMQQFVSFIESTMLSVDEYIKLLKDETAKILSSKIVGLNNRESSIGSILLNMERLIQSEDSDLPCQIINTVSYLNSEEIPFNIIKLIFQNHDLIDLDVAIRKLQSFSLINIKYDGENNKCISIHSLVQKALRYQHKDSNEFIIKLKQMFCRKLDVKEEQYEHVDFGKEWYMQFICFVKSNIQNNLVYQMCIEKGK